MSEPVILEPYKIVNIAETEFNNDACALIIKYTHLERFYFPVLISLVAVGISLWLVIEVSHERMSILARSALLGGVVAVSCLLFWHAVRNGSFVLAANRKGIYYRTSADKSSLVFIAWEAVKNVSVYYDGSRELEIEMLFEGPLKLPAPCNGTRFVKNGRPAVSLYLGLAGKTPDIMDKIANLRHP